MEQLTNGQRAGRIIIRCGAAKDEGMKAAVSLRPLTALHGTWLPC